MKNKIKYIICLLLVLTSLVGRSQTYPVQAFVTITPPYSSYLPDYADPFNNQMKVLLTSLDYNAPSLQVKLRFKIEGQGYSIQSADINNMTGIPAITLSPGVPVEVSGSGLAPYLNSDNLLFSGLNKNEYIQSQILPEGPATICVEVINVSNPNNAVLNNPACASTWFAKYNPPLLATPFCGQELLPTDPPQIMFSWTPLHMAAPTNGQTQYVLEMCPILEGDDPNYVFQSVFTPKLVSDPTTNTFFNYGISEAGSFPLTVGQSYVWRVKAFDGSGRALFTNDGYSAPCVFTYGNVAASLLDGVQINLTAQGTGQTVGTADWDKISVCESYVLEVRKTGNQNNNWFPINTSKDKEKIYMLEPETEYECRVKGIAGTAETDWSNTAVFTTLPERNYECGSTNLPGKPANIKPLQNLMPGMKVQTGQFVMEVVLAEPATSGQPGHFRGTGRIPITFLATANVEFEDILVDENLIHFDGRIDVMTENVQDWINSYDNIYVDGVITNYQSNAADSKVIIYLDNGDSLTFDWPPPGQTTTIVDDSGHIYTIDENGNVVITVATTADNDHLDATANYQIYFIEHPNQTYGFDRLTYEAWTVHYPCISLDDGSKYFVPYKSLRVQQQDKFYAVIKAQTPFTPTFTTASGVELSSTKVNDTLYEVTVDNFATAQFIYGYDNTGKKLGKLNLSVYENKFNEVVVVPVNGATVPAESALENEINAIFKQASASFDITVAPNFEVNYDLNNNGLDGASDSTLSLYSEEMKTIRRVYFDSTAKENKLYLFVVPEIAGDLKGYMVRGKIIGFIENGQPARTYAHELGHGAFGLEHTFPEVPLRGSDNILDYAGGTHMTHEQWYTVQHFTPTWSFLDNAMDGAMEVDSYTEIHKFYHDSLVWKNVPANHAVTLLDGTFVKIPGLTKAIFDIYGKVFKFEANGVVYIAGVAATNDYVSYGYLSQSDLDLHRAGMSSSMDFDWEFLKSHRYANYQSVEIGNEVYGVFPKIFGGAYTDCNCEQTWKAHERTSASTYVNNLGYIWLIDYSIEREGEIAYNNCEGVCIDLSNYVSGPADGLITQLSKKFEDQQAIIDIATYINSKIPQGKKFAFYSPKEDGIGNSHFTSPISDKIDASNTGLASFLVHHEINTLAKFKEEFGESISSGASDVDLIFSKVDLWSGVDKQKYNQYTKDYVLLKSTGQQSLYHYSFKDLVYRDAYRIEGSVIWTGILHNESEGFGEAIYLQNGYDQYVAKYGTNSAAFALMEAFVETMGPVFIAYAGYEVVALFAEVSISAALTEVVQFARALAPIISNLIRQYVTKRARSAIIAGIKSYVAYVLIDATLRYVMDLEPDIQSALLAVDQGAAILQGTTDGLAAFIDMPDLDMSLFQAMGTCLVGMQEAQNNGTSQSEQCLFNAMVSMIASSSGNIIQILVNRIKALGAKSVSFINMLRAYLDPTDPFYENFDLPPVNTSLLSALKQKFSGYQHILDWLDEIGDNSILTKLDDLPNDQNIVGKLNQDLADNQGLKQIFNQNPQNIISWKILNNANRPTLRIDALTLEKVSELTTNVKIQQVFGNDYITVIENICSAHKNGFSGVKSLKAHLDDVLDCTVKFGDVQGFSPPPNTSLVNAMTNNNSKVQDGLNHMLTKIKNLTAGSITEFEGNIVDGLMDVDNLDDICTGCQFDVLLTSGKKIEFKSYSTSTINGIGGNGSGAQKFQNQFFAYLADANNMNSFEYVFNISKISDIDVIKNGFRNLYENKASDMYNLLGEQKFIDLFGVDNVQDFIEDVVPNLDGNAYSFIKLY